MLGHIQLLLRVQLEEEECQPWLVTGFETFEDVEFYLNFHPKAHPMLITITDMYSHSSVNIPGFKSAKGECPGS